MVIFVTGTASFVGSNRRLLEAGKPNETYSVGVWYEKANLDVVNNPYPILQVLHCVLMARARAK